MNTATKGALVATAVAALFAAHGALAANKDAGKAEAQKVKCEGVNECKGQGACHGVSNECAGQNACKGKGWIETSAADCKAKGGKFKE
jgi:uncharacterized membrane protein